MINPKHGFDGVLFSSIKGYYMHSPWKYLDQLISTPLERNKNNGKHTTYAFRIKSIVHLN